MEHRIDPLFFDRWLEKNGIEHVGHRGLRLIKSESPEIWNAMLHEYEGWYYAYHGRSLRIKRRNIWTHRVEPMWADPTVVELDGGGEPPIELALDSLRTLRDLATNEPEPIEVPKPKPKPWKPPKHWHPPFVAPVKRTTARYQPPFGPRAYVEYQGLQIPYEFKEDWCRSKNFEPWEIDSHYHKKKIMADLEADYIESLMVEVRRQQEADRQKKQWEEFDRKWVRYLEGHGERPEMDPSLNPELREDAKIDTVEYWRFRGLSLESAKLMACETSSRNWETTGCISGPRNVRLAEEWAKFNW